MANNLNSGIFNACLGIGQILGPLFGATVYARLNFRLTQDIMALICITFSILYFIFAEGRSGFRNTFKGRDDSEIQIKSKLPTKNIDNDDDYEAASKSEIKA